MKKNRRQEFSRWVTATKNVNSHYFHEKMTQNKSSSMPMENLHLWVTETDCHKWTLIIHFFRLQAQVLWKRDGLLREVFCQGSHCTSKEAVYGHSPISQERRFMDEVIMMSQERRFMDTVWWVKRGGLWTQSDESSEAAYGHSLMSQKRRFMDTVWWVKRGGLWTQSDESSEAVYGHSLMSFHPVISTSWADVDWSWPRECHWCAQADLCRYKAKDIALSVAWWRETERGSTWQSSLKGWDRAIIITPSIA